MLAKEPLGIKVMTDIVCRTVNEEISNMCRRSENSVYLLQFMVTNTKKHEPKDDL